MGFVGDWIGRKEAMDVTLILTAAGCIACAFFTFNTGTTSYYCHMIAYRLIVGVGVGGTMPLSAATAAESKDKHTEAGGGEVHVGGSVQGGRVRWSARRIEFKGCCSSQKLGAGVS